MKHVKNITQIPAPAKIGPLQAFFIGKVAQDYNEYDHIVYQKEHAKGA